MFFTGTFSRAIDEKLRVAIPSKVRAAIGRSTSLYLAPGTDASLALYTEAAFKHLAERLDQAPPTRDDVRTFTRLFYAQAQLVELDQQGRIRIPSELAQQAGLRDEVMLIGVRDHLEFWPAERWKAYLAQKQAQYDQIAEAAFGARPRPNAAPSTS